MSAPKRGRTGRKRMTGLDPKTRALLAAICHAGPVLDGLPEPTEAQWRLLRDDVWRRWVAELKTYKSPGYSTLPYAAERFDNVPEDITRVPHFAMSALVKWMADRRTFAEKRLAPNEAIDEHGNIKKYDTPIHA